MGGQCYYFDTNQRSREEAKSYCTSNHGKLWEPKTKKKINELHTKAMSVSTNHHWWIGMTDTESEGTFKFDTNGEEFPFPGKNSPWRFDEPGGGSSQNCAFMERNNPLEFHDSGCNLQLYPICEATFDSKGNIKI